jgi:hypothetical protein
VPPSSSTAAPTTTGTTAGGSEHGAETSAAAGKRHNRSVSGVDVMVGDECFDSLNHLIEQSEVNLVGHSEEEVRLSLFFVILLVFFISVNLWLIKL